MKEVDQDRDISSDSCPWEFEHRTEGGFLLGDPIDISSEKLSSVVPFWEAGIISMLSEETALMSSPDLNYLSLINLRKVDRNREDSVPVVQELAFSINGETLYVVSNTETTQVAVTAWEVSNTKIRGRLQLRLISLVPVKDGVVLLAQNKSPELWNFRLSTCVRRWSTLNGITKIIPISDEVLACLGSQSDVNVLSTADQEIVSTIQPFELSNVIACNSKCQLITVGQKNHFGPNVKDGWVEETLRLSDATSLVWERDLSRPWCKDSKDQPHCIFSPKEEFVVVWGQPLLDGPGVHILDAISGDTHHTLPNSKNVVDCKFVSDEECVVYNRGINVIRLFSVTSGNLLSVMDIEERPSCLAVCLAHQLIAICLTSDRFRLIRVWLPHAENRRKSKRLDLLGASLYKISAPCSNWAWQYQPTLKRNKKQIS